MDPLAIISELERSGGLSEVTHKISFHGYRGERMQGVFVDIFDRGPSAGNLRYYCKAVTEDGKRMATGNPAATVGVALAGVHWYDLDRDDA